MVSVWVVFLTVVAMLIPRTGYAQAIEGDAKIIRRDFSFGGVDYEYVLGLQKTTSFDGGDAGGLFQFFIDDMGSNHVEFEYAGIAERFALFFSFPGDEITPAFVNNATPFASNYIRQDPRNPTTDFETLKLAIGESVYFGYWDDRSAWLSGREETADSDDSFGWFELHRSGRFDSSYYQLEIRGGATAIGQGIVVGTTNTITIPEPTVAIVLGLFGVLTFTSRRRNRTWSC